MKTSTNTEITKTYKVESIKMDAMEGYLYVNRRSDLVQERVPLCSVGRVGLTTIRQHGYVIENAFTDLFLNSILVLQSCKGKQK